jgi:hypothetical protein
MKESKFISWLSGFVIIFLVCLSLYTIKRFLNIFNGISFIEIWGSAVIVINILSGLYLPKNVEK